MTSSIHKSANSISKDESDWNSDGHVTVVISDKEELPEN